jgi:signal transduction histidine kinase/FixJ family two-component response regulator
VVLRPRPDRILDYREYPVLYVDDEVENLRIFELTFRREFSIATATNGESGIELINQEPIALVLSDQRMPGMMGTEFLSRVAELDPKTVRVLVTAYGDADTLGDAINIGSIYRFVPKPWTPDEMRMTLRRGIEVYALDRERDQLLRELKLLNGVSKSISQELDLEALIELLLETITTEFGYDAAGILFLDGKQERLVWNKIRPYDAKVTESLRQIEISRTSARKFFGNLCDSRVQIIEFTDVLDLESPIRQWITEVASEEILVVPLVGRSGVIGAFFVDNRRGGTRFSAEDRTLLEGLANQAVIAMENARLVEDLRRSREQVMRSDRLGTLGTLAAGLAHEINNPLVSIHTFLSMAPGKRFENDNEFWSEYHSLASSEVERIRRLVETMRQLGRKDGGDAARELVDLAELGAQVLALVSREASREGIEISCDGDSSTPKIVGVRDQLHQVFMNLLLNAIEATPEKGSVKVRTFADVQGRMSCIEVSDTGPGIAAEDLEQVFDPFYTTKEPDQGTGLGLMICHRIVTDHDGTIEVRRSDSGGALFCVRLPFGKDSDGGG